MKALVLPAIAGLIPALAALRWAFSSASRSSMTLTRVMSLSRDNGRGMVLVSLLFKFLFKLVNCALEARKLKGCVVFGDSVQNLLVCCLDDLGEFCGFKINRSHGVCSFSKITGFGVARSPVVFTSCGWVRFLRLTQCRRHRSIRYRQRLLQYSRTHFPYNFLHRQIAIQFARL